MIGVKRECQRVKDLRSKLGPKELPDLNNGGLAVEANQTASFPFKRYSLARTLFWEASYPAISLSTTPSHLSLCSIGSDSEVLQQKELSCPKNHRL